MKTRQSQSGCGKMQEPMPLFDVSGAAESDRPRLSRQATIMLERLKKGPATNYELANLSRALNPSARISDVRKYLRSNGKDLKAAPISDGVWKYEIK